jgi:PEP-CTERM motif-containing protein
MHDLFPSITRPARRLGLLSGVALGALFAAGQPADALTITPVFQGAFPVAAQNVVNSVIAEYQGDFSNNVSVTIAFGWGTLNGSPITSGAATVFAANDFPPPFGSATPFTLAQVKGFYAGAAGAPGATQVLVTANAHLPATYPNPGGSTGFFIPDAEYKALTGMALNGDPIDGFTGYATNFCGGGTCPYDFTGGVPPANAIDFKAVVEHELSHALSRVDYAFSSGTSGGAPPFLTPQDFFKYVCGTPNLDPKFDIACFSYDGDMTNPQGRTFSNSSDSGDWINAGGDSFNAFIGQGQFASVSMADLLLMCAEGWNDGAVCGTQVTGTPEPGTLALLGTSLLGFAALRRRRRRT